MKRDIPILIFSFVLTVILIFAFFYPLKKYQKKWYSTLEYGDVNIYKRVGLFIFGEREKEGIGHYPPLISFLLVLFAKLAGNYFWGIFIFNSLFNIIALTLFLKITNLKLSLLMMFFPSFLISLVFNVSEPLFLLLLVFSLYFFLKEKYHYSLFLSSLCIFVRLILVVPFMFLIGIILQKRFRLIYLIYPIIAFVLFFSWYGMIFNNIFYVFEVHQNKYHYNVLKKPPLVNAWLNTSIKTNLFSFPYLILMILSAWKSFKLKNKIFLSSTVLQSAYYIFLTSSPAVWIWYQRFFLSLLPFVLICFKNEIEKHYRIILPVVMIWGFISVMVFGGYTEELRVLAKSWGFSFIASSI